MFLITHTECRILQSVCTLDGDMKQLLLKKKSQQPSDSFAKQDSRSEAMDLSLTKTFQSEEASRNYPKTALDLSVNIYYKERATILWTKLCEAAACF